MADAEISVHRRSLDRLEPPRLPGGNGGSRGRRLLAVRQGQVWSIRVRLLSGKRTLAGRSHSSARRDPARAAAHSVHSLQGTQCDSFFGVFPVVAFFLLVGGVFGLPHVETRVWGGLLVTLVI